MRSAALLALAFVLLAAAPAASADLTVGIGEQNAAFFSDERWQKLKIKHVRIVVPWNVLHSGWQTAELDAWMAAAEAGNARVLMTFGHARERRVRHLPTRDELAREFRALRRRYPFVNTFQAWNEANHGTQPTWRRPDRVARYYDMMKRNCPRCTVVAPSVLDASNMLRWIREFRRVARRKIRVWSIHNHIDANRHRTLGTRKLLRHTRGKVWFTETGGIVMRVVDGRRRREYNRRNAVKATRNVFRLARLSKRVTRVYFYHWLAPPERRPRWDSAFIAPNGRERPALTVVKRQLRRAR
jgi:hypothetical protein